METFIVRLWDPASGVQPLPPGLHGVVERVGDPQTRTFGDGAELIRHLSEALGLEAPPPDTDAIARD
jgi:hypothetical protein